MPKRADVETSRFFIEMRFADACLAPVDDMSVFSSGLLDSFGFFYKNRHNPYLKSAADIFSLRGAILVAEGGLGKTYVIDSFAAQISKTSYIKIAAGEYCGNSTDFSADLSKIPDVIEYIFIDGVDEAPDVIPTLLRKLKLIIREHDHIHIFIALRNIRQLKAVHDELSLPIYSLLPLSRDDVLLIAKQKNLDGAAFIDKVVREGLAPICAKPQGCNALISGYKNNKLENTTCQKLWEQSILSLCAENDSSTRLAGETDSSCITPEECLRQSAKIALILKLSGNNVVRGIQNSLPDASEKSVFLSSFYESDAAAKINTILSRAIFMPIGNNRFRFSHFSYFDYLTAIGLLNAVNPKHWETILLSPDKTAVYPCWEGAAAWLAAYTPEWCDIILDIQPELLLVSDYAISMAGAEKLCSAIIKRADKLDQRQRYDSFFIKRLAKLNSPQIIPLLDETLSERSTNEQVEMAIDIIRECQIHELEDRLVKLFCDSKADHELRKHAGYALCDFASSRSKDLCKHILQEEECSLDLKGLLFRMTWPTLVTMNEMAPHLTEPRSGLLDAYHFWASHDFPISLLELTEEKSKEALQWAVAVVVKPEDYRDTLLNMRRQVYTLCWRNFACPVFMPMLTQGMLGFIKIHSLPFADEHIHGTPPALCYTNTDFHEDVEKRRLLVETAVNTLSIPEDDLGLVAEHVLFDTDVDFVFDMIEKPIPPMLYRRWCICLRSLQRLIPFPEMSQRWNDIHYRLPEIISFDAETIIFQRKKWNDELTKSKNNSKRLASDRHKRQQEQRNRSLRFIKSVLKNTDAYKFLPQIITFIMNEAGIDNIDFRNSDIWKEFSPSEIKSLTLAARDFLIKGKKSSFPRTKYSIYPFIPRAFFLVWAEYQCRLKDLPVEAWEEFSLLLFDCLYLNDNDILRPIFESMSQFAPHIYRAAMLEKIKGDAAGGELHITIKYGDLLDDETCEEIIRFAASKKCSDIQRFWLLNTVHGIAPAVVNDFVSKKFLPLQSDITCLGNCVSILVLKILPDKIHDFVQRLVTSSTKWGKAWITDIVKIDRYGGALTASVFRAAAVNDLVVFYIWLHKNYPTSEFPVHEEAYSPSTVDDIYSFIGNIFKIIKDSCSINALSALRHIFAEFPDENWLKMEIIDVDRNYLRECTPVYTAEEINRIIANSEDAIINSSRDLLRVIYALLEDYQIYLTGKDSPRVDDLWNYDNKGGVSHKNEEHFSNHLKSFLTMRLNGKNIAINREVRLNNGIKGAKGSQTDIWINAFSHNGSKNLTLCIEVKGSWNRETHTAMNKQLIGKYMGAGGAAAGILLVGWFQSQSNPVQNVCKNNRLELETMLMQQEGLAIAAGHLVKSIVIDCQAKY